MDSAMRPELYNLRVTCTILLFSVLFYLGYTKGWITEIYNADQTYLVYVITSLLGAGWAALFLGKQHVINILAGSMASLGLIGTMLGLYIAVGDLDPEKFGDAEYAATTGSQLIVGLKTALSTTIVGAIGSTWLLFSKLLVGNHE